MGAEAAMVQVVVEMVVTQRAVSEAASTMVASQAEASMGGAVKAMKVEVDRAAVAAVQGAGVMV